MIIDTCINLQKSVMLYTNVLKLDWLLDFPGAVQRRVNLTLTHELLQRHFSCLYMELEPREIADEMFQAGHLTLFDHDNVTESNQRYKRLSFLLNILMKKELYAQLVCTLQSLGYRSVLDTLQKDRKLKNKPCKY